MYIIFANILIIIFGPFLLYSIDVEIYRLLASHAGRMLTTIVQTLFSVTAGLLWLYLWRRSFILLFQKLLQQRTQPRGTT